MRFQYFHDSDDLGKGMWTKRIHIRANIYRWGYDKLELFGSGGKQFELQNLPSSDREAIERILEEVRQDLKQVDLEDAV